MLLYSAFGLDFRPSRLLYTLKDKESISSYASVVVRNPRTDGVSSSSICIRGNLVRNPIQALEHA